MPKRYIPEGLLILLCIGLGCNEKPQTNEHKKFFEQVAAPTKQDSILLMGESSHGIANFYELKSGLVRHLYQKQDFDLLVFESGMLDVAYHYHNLQPSDSTKAFIDKTVFCKSDKLIPLFHLIKRSTQSPNPLILAGIDVQSSQTDEVLKAITGHYYGFDTLKDQMFQMAMEGQIEPYNRLSETFTQRIAQAEKKLKTVNIPGYLAPYVLRGLKQQKMFYGFQYSNDIDKEFQQHDELRDSLMASNFIWLRDSVYPDKKAMVWAHNGHIMKDNNNPETQMLGETLHEQYGETIFSLGLVAYTGTAFEQFPNKDTIPFKNNHPKSLTHKTYSESNSSTFKVFHKKDTLPTFIYENTTDTSVIKPARAFDGLIVLDSVRYENYLNF